VAEPVPIETLRDELAEWMARLEKAGEDWLTARAARTSTDAVDRRIREAEQHTRRLERRINRRT
jgi:flagellar biosynthesis chaperone FliJ